MATLTPPPENDQATDAPPPPPPPPPPPGAVRSSEELDARILELQTELTGLKKSLRRAKLFLVSNIAFITSITLHLALLVFGYLTIKVVEQINRVIQEQIIIPDATIVENAEAGGIQNPGLGGDPSRAAAQDLDQSVAPTNDAWADKPNQTLNQTVMGGSETDNSASAISLGAAASFSKGSNKGPGSGESGGASAQFGVPGGGGGTGPRSTFAGTSGNATRIVYLCDASGTMMSIFDSLRAELIKSVKKLIPIQGFNVIFFQEDQVLTLSKGTLVMANPANKSKAYEFIEKSTARGPTDPVPAIKAAFAQKPQLIYMLTDGFDNLQISNEELLKQIRDLNTDHSVKINTIYIGRQEDNKELVTLLQKIANDNGGVAVTVARDAF